MPALLRFGPSGKLSQGNEQMSCPADSIRTLCQGKNKSRSSLGTQLGATVSWFWLGLLPHRAAPQQGSNGREGKSPGAEAERSWRSPRRLRLKRNVKDRRKSKH